MGAEAEVVEMGRRGLLLAFYGEEEIDAIVRYFLVQCKIRATRFRVFGGSERGTLFECKPPSHLIQIVIRGFLAIRDCLANICPRLGP